MLRFNGKLFILKSLRMEIMESAKCYKFVSGEFVFLVSFIVLDLRRHGVFSILALGHIKDFAEWTSTGTSLSTTTVS